MCCDSYIVKAWEICAVSDSAKRKMKRVRNAEKVRRKELVDIHTAEKRKLKGKIQIMTDKNIENYR